MTHTLLAVDPGKSDAGVAFYVAGALTEVAWLQVKDQTDLAPVALAAHVTMWWRRCMHNLGTPDGRVSMLVCEGQQVYPGPRRNDPNQLLPLAIMVGATMASVDAFDRQIVLPRVWTGSIPKEVRQRHWLAGLSEREQALIKAIKAPKAKIHNAVDAAMIGAYSLGRLKDQTRSYQQ